MTLKDLINEANVVVPKISCKELLINKDNCNIIDVRERTEIHETGKIPNSKNIPRGLIEMNLSITNQNDDLNFDTPIVVYCGGGSRASLAGKTIMDMGYKNVKNLQGGYRGWKKFSN